MAKSAARVVRLFGFDPKVAFLSHSTFGEPATDRTKRLSDAVEILKKDIDDDGFVDIIISGNMFNSEVETPRNDGSVGVLLKFEPNSGFNAVPARQSGLFLNGDVKDMEFISLNNNDYIISSKNNDLIEFTRIK